MRTRLIAFLLAASAATSASAQLGRSQNAARFDAMAKDIDAAVDAGDYARAEDLARQRLSLAGYVVERKQGNAYRSLGFVLRMRGKYADAEAVLKQGLPISERTRGRNSEHFFFNDPATTEIYTAQSRYAEARSAL